MAKLRAAVLAAGRGVRMGGRLPKTLIPVGDHEPLLHYILAGLRRAGVDDLLVVTGFEPAQVQSFVDEHWSGGEVTYVFNARYASWGNFHTVRMALDQSPGMNVMFVNSDVIVHPDVYARAATNSGDLVLAVQKRPPHLLNEEDMRVKLQRDQVQAIGKDLSRAHSHGEFAGVSLVKPAAAREYLQYATDLEWRAATTLYYEDVYGAVIPRVDTRAAWVGPDEYAEVDEPSDLDSAAHVIETNASVWEGAEAPATVA
ncbi:MAG TPA: NTP transferase domain-containing protein [Actinomycetota bacterium]|nr:NTP transferase domain-containing protein [Actinomycetota bacterium]